MTKRYLIFMLALVATMNLSGWSQVAHSVDLSGTTDLSSNDEPGAEMAGSGDDLPAAPTDEDDDGDQAGASDVADSDPIVREEIDNCVRDKKGKEFPEDSVAQLECQAELLGDMETSSEATDYYNEYFQSYLQTLVNSESEADHKLAEDLVKKLNREVKSKKFTYVETSLKEMEEQLKFHKNKDEIKNQIQALDPNDPDREAKLAELQKKLNFVEMQRTGSIVDKTLDATNTADGSSADGSGALTQLSENMDSIQADLKRIQENYGIIASRDARAQLGNGESVEQKASLVTDQGLGLPAPPTFTEKVLTINNSSMPMVDASVN